MKDILDSKWGVAFGGGGAKGSAHIGVIKAFEEHNIQPYGVSGTSIGALIAALYSFGYDTKEISKEFLRLEPFSISFLRPTGLGIMSNRSLENVLLDKFDRSTKIEEAKIPLAIHTTDIENGRPETLTKGPLIDSVMASCCVPGLYIPPKIAPDKTLVDGGLTENVPLSALYKIDCDKTVGINLNGQARYSKPKNLLHVLTNSFDIAIDHQTRLQIKKADYSLDLDLTIFSRFVIQDVDKMIDIAYKKVCDSILS